MNGRRARFLLWLVAACAVASACSGGGSSSTPVPAASIPGQGSTEPLDQKISLRIEVPAEAAGLIPSATAARAHHRSAAATPPTYLSPKTGSIELELAAIGGLSFAQTPPLIPPIDVPAGCQGSAAGCVFTAANIIAAKGVNTYFVTTYSGANATGNVISTGFINVTAPASSVATFGGAAGALSIGGFVGSLALAPGQLTFTQGTPGSHGVLVQAFDPAGAAIVGSSQYANPVVVSVADSVNFNFGGSGAQVSLAQPITTPLPLRYLGGTSLAGGTLVTASTTNENNAPASAAPLVVTLTAPTPCATDCPTSPPSAYSVYVDLTDIDTIQEYAIGAAVETGTAPVPAPNATLPPRRSLTFVPGSVSGGAASCETNYTSNSLPAGNGTQGVAVSANGTIVIAPTCTQGTNTVMFGYPATAVGSPPPSLNFPVPISQVTISSPNGLAIDASRNLVFESFPDAPSEFDGWPLTASSISPSVIVGANCINEIGYTDCSTTGSGGYPGYFGESYAGFGIDSAANVYAPSFYEDPTTCDSQSAPGGGGASFGLCPAVAVVQANGIAQESNAYSAIAGAATELGGPAGPPLAATVDGNMLYVLVNGTLGNGNGTYAGLSGCGSTLDSANLLCADGSTHNYLVGYRIGPDILGPAVQGTNVNITPLFELGGDVQNRFGCPGAPIEFGQYLAARDGYVYVINPTPTCPGGTAVVAPEIDVYNTNGLSGPTIAKALVYQIPFASTTNFPTAVAVGPVGPASAVGGAFSHRTKPRPYRESFYPKGLRRKVRSSTLKRAAGGS